MLVLYGEKIEEARQSLDKISLGHCENLATSPKLHLGCKSGIENRQTSKQASFKRTSGKSPVNSNQGLVSHPSGYMVLKEKHKLLLDDED